MERIHFTHADRARILAKTGGCCAKCGRKLDTKSMTVDHIVPVSKGGDNDEYNLVALCQECNLTKGNAVIHPEEYYQHVLPQYVWEYKKHSVELQNHTQQFNSQVFGLSMQRYSMLPNNMVPKVYAAIRRNKKAGEAFAEKVMLHFSLERWQGDDVSEIMAFIEKYAKDEKGNYIDPTIEQLYSDEYKVRNAMVQGEVYTIQMSNEIYGLIILRKAEYFDFTCMQWDQMADILALKRKYILMVNLVSPKIEKLGRTIFYDIVTAMMASYSVPAVFSCESTDQPPKSVIVMPCKIDGYAEGEIQIPTVNYMRELLKIGVPQYAEDVYNISLSKNQCADIVEDMLYDENHVGKARLDLGIIRAAEENVLPFPNSSELIGASVNF